MEELRVTGAENKRLGQIALNSPKKLEELDTRGGDRRRESEGRDIRRARLVRIDREEEELASSGCTWYEVKASTLKKSDIPLIKDKTWMFDRFEVIIPEVEDRIHRPLWVSTLFM
ncbi:hypothetical protein F511_40712 [Dorcoceras hygrometricum]|uniref:Uncharacterized protein n=1 Tax=Dorcoceras hygrometricum TaxID=472368 RepID=A0A2Z7B932_9LAMI|nr:hypothetical protein F511_40712 [Dorcoceras hygrometricum]